ncbi:MAG: hypothetical protein LBB98_06000 [Treponema sp.]|jgi:hypothetical protein|nr:hypothetical protein [Treponema sp.]
MKQILFFSIPKCDFLEIFFASRSGLKPKASSSRRALLPLSLAFAFFACREPVIPPSCRIVLPALPPAWEAILGPTRWRVEWFNPDGHLRSGEGPASTLPEADLPAEWASPVLAYPFWPERGLAPGFMRPAGAIAPFDIENGRIILTWEAGPEAWFYRALTAAYNAAELPVAAAGRRPDRLDWPRFRTLLRSGDIPPEIREDPWLADWDTIAEKTVQSGFDRRRIRARSFEPLIMSVPWPGPWAGSSPFAEVRLWEAGETVTVEAVTEADTLISSGGMLRYNSKGAIRVPWKEQEQ